MDYVYYVIGVVAILTLGYIIYTRAKTSKSKPTTGGGGGSAKPGTTTKPK